jgi:hypothetical protein
MLLELNALVGQHPGHIGDLLFAAPMKPQNLALIGGKFVFRASNDSKVGVSLLVDTHRHLELGEL